MYCRGDEREYKIHEAARAKKTIIQNTPFTYPTAFY